MANKLRSIFSNRIPMLWYILAMIQISVSCNQAEKGAVKDADGTVKIVGAIRNVMMKGELFSNIKLDTITNREHLFGVGPLEYLKGEIMIWDGTAYYSKVKPDSSMAVESSFEIKAPFFVYAKVDSWEEFQLPDSVHSDMDLESYLDKITKNRKRPFAFKLTTEIDTAKIHVVNLADGAVVSSPDGPHDGQMDYLSVQKPVDIIGFFSTGHQGIFTHHSSYVHMHLITKDRKLMGHVDELKFKLGNTKVYLPTN